MKTEEARGRPGPPSPRVVHLKNQVKRKLVHLVRAGTTENRVATRARMILLRSEDVPVREIGRRLGVSDDSVQRWCDRFKTDGVDGLRDLPRPGRPRKLSLETSASL